MATTVRDSGGGAGLRGAADVALRAGACFLVAAGALRLAQDEYRMALVDWLGAAIGLFGFGLFGLWPQVQATPPLLTDEEVLDRVLALARQEQVPILPRSCFGADLAACYDHQIGIIWIRPEHHRSPWILLHELGHRALLIAGKWPHSEAEADQAGRELALSLLTQEEAHALRRRLDLWLPVAPA